MSEKHVDSRNHRSQHPDRDNDRRGCACGNVFALGGIGDVLISGIKASDYPVVQGITLMLVTFFALMNLAVDIVYALIDPRIRYGNEGRGE